MSYWKKFFRDWEKIDQNFRARSEAERLEAKGKLADVPKPAPECKHGCIETKTGVFVSYREGFGDRYCRDCGDKLIT